MTVDEDVAADYALMGATIDAHEVVRKDGVFEVWPINWDSVRAFLACETQWRVVSTFNRVMETGLDYSGVDVVLRRLGFGDHVFADLQEMEVEAISIFARAGE